MPFCFSVIFYIIFFLPHIASHLLNKCPFSELMKYLFIYCIKGCIFSYFEVSNMFILQSFMEYKNVNCKTSS